MDTYQILVIDDQDDIIEAIRIVLAREKHLQLSCYRSPLEAIRAIEKLDEKDNPFAVAIVDVMLPEMTGIEFITRFKTLRPQTVTVNMSSHADLKLVLEALSSNHIFDFIQKPILSDHLKNTIKRALKHYCIKKERDELAVTLKTKNQQLEDWNTKLDSLVKEKTFELKLRDELMQHLSGCHSLNDPFSAITMFCDKICPNACPIVLSITPKGWAVILSPGTTTPSPKADRNPNAGPLSKQDLKQWQLWLNETSELQWGEVLSHRGVVTGLWLVCGSPLSKKQQDSLSNFSTLVGLLIYDEQSLDSIDGINTLFANS